MDSSFIQWIGKNISTEEFKLLGKLGRHLLIKRENNANQIAASLIGTAIPRVKLLTTEDHYWLACTEFGCASRAKVKGAAHPVSA